MRCPQCGAWLRDGAQVCDTCGATIPPPASFGGQADPWAGSEPFMAGLPDPWDDQRAPSGAGATPHTLGDLFDPATPPQSPPTPPMRAPKQGALPPVGGSAPGSRGRPGMGRSMPTPAPAWPDTSGGGGAGFAADANLPGWLFERPQGWQSPESNASGQPDPWDSPPGPPFSAAVPGSPEQGAAWSDLSPAAGGWSTPAAPLSRAGGTPRGSLAGRGPATPMRQLGQMGQMFPSAADWGDSIDPMVPPPPPPPAPVWKRPPAPPSAPLGDAWPTVAPSPPAKNGGKRGWGRLSLPFKMGRGGRAAAPRQPAASRRVAGSMAQPSEGRGWHIVTPLNPQNPPQPFSYLAPVAPRGPSRTFALVTGLSRLTFNLLLLGIIIAILAIPISIGLSKLAGQHGPVVSIHPTATPRMVAPAPPGYKQLLGSALVVDYPAAWKHGTFSMPIGCGCDAPQTVQGDVFQNSDYASFAVAALQAVPSSSLQPILNVGVLPITPERTDSLNMVVTPQLGPTVDGVQWQADEYTFNLIGAQQTVRMHAVAMAANRGAYTYIIVYQAPDSQFASLRSQNFQAMLASFRFRP